MSDAPRVLVTPRSLQPRDGRHHPIIERLVEAGAWPYYPDRRGPLPADAMRTLLAEASAAIIGLDTVDRAAVEAAPRLKVLARFGTGYDRVDVAACTARGVAVTITPGANAVAVAEYTLGLMLALARHVPRHHQDVLEGRWRPRAGIELSGRRLGIVGLGRIGQEVARRASAFGMRVGYHDIVRKSPDVEEALSVTYMSLDDLLQWADIVTLHAPYTPGSSPLLGRRELGLAREGVLIINTARGELIDEASLADSLRSGRVGGAALDVLSQEPPPPSHPLLSAPNVILSPHAAAQTAEARDRMAEAAVESVLDALSGRRPRNVINPEVYGPRP
ncbi:MAG: phosphoglycerate dehydrogenase [Firmicutes bacterium]|nr:phosphoglycerate dehydrogenase [Bacillota bacterium]